MSGNKIDIENASLAQLEKGGLDMQQKSKEAVKRMQGKLEQAHEIADAAAIELQRQNEQILRIDTKLGQIDNAGVRLQKYLRYFGREAQGDKTMLGLCCCLIIGIGLLITAWTMPNKEKVYGDQIAT